MRHRSALRCLVSISQRFAVIAVMLVLAGFATGQESLPPPGPAQPLPLAGTGSGDNARIRQQVDEYLKELETKRKEEQKKKDEEDKKKKDEAKKKDEEPKSVEVTNGGPMSASFDNGLFFTSANKDWRVHVGGRFEFNSVWWNQPEALKASPPGPGGLPAATATAGRGVGPLDDGMYFRRVRFRADGTGYETVEFMMEVDFENLNLIAFDHMWVGMKDVPFLGTVRIGQHKVPQGLDMYGSDYYLTFMERSVLSEAFLTLFAPGIYISNTYFDQNVTTHAMFHRVQPLQYYDGAAFGDGEYAFTTRATWTPYYAQDGACLVHLGGSYQYRTGNGGRGILPGASGNAFLDTQSVVRFRGRPEMRDGVGILTPILGGNAGRFIDTGFITANDVQTLCPEFMTTWGPINVRAEAACAYVDNAATVLNNTVTQRGSPFFWGAYVQASYFLTGEHWGYDRRFGVYDRPKVNENAFLVRGEDGCYHHGLGAWELAYRYSYADLNDNGINGGQLGQHTFGVNWYLNENFRIQANYLDIQRNVKIPAISGNIHAFGVQAQWYF